MRRGCLEALLQPCYMAWRPAACGLFAPHHCRFALPLHCVGQMPAVAAILCCSLTLFAPSPDPTNPRQVTPDQYLTTEEFMDAVASTFQAARAAKA